MNKMVWYISKYFPVKMVSPDILLNYTSSADYGISFIEDVCLSYRFCLPNKIFEYFMTGIPVVVSNLFEMKQMVETYDVGVVAKDNTINGIINAINHILSKYYSQMIENVCEARKVFNWEAQERVLLKIYSELK